MNKLRKLLRRVLTREAKPDGSHATSEETAHQQEHSSNEGDRFDELNSNHRCNDYSEIDEHDDETLRALNGRGSGSEAATVRPQTRFLAKGVSSRDENGEGKDKVQVQQSRSQSPPPPPSPPSLQRSTSSGRRSKYSPKLSRRARKDRATNLILSDLMDEPSKKKAKAETADTDRENPQSFLEGLELHYFWGSKFFLQIYAVCLAAVVTRNPWVLHGISFVFIGALLERTYTWGVFFYESREAREFYQLTYWWINFALGEVEKVLQGDTLRSALAGFSFQMWNSLGKSVVFAVLRMQYKEINQKILRETREALESSSRMQQKLSRGGLELAQSVKKARVFSRGGGMHRS